MTTFRFSLLSVSLALLLASTSALAQPDSQPSSQPQAQQQNVAREPSSPDNEWPDCVTGCPHSDPRLLIDLSSPTYDAYRGTIDGQSHTFRGQGGAIERIAKDVDIVDVYAEGRTFVEIVVEPVEGSPMNPVILLSDGIRTVAYNDDADEGNFTARTVFAMPYSQNLPIYAVIQEAVNYERFGSPNLSDFVGGDEYAYNLRFDTWPFEGDGTDGRGVRELGELTPDNPTARVTGVTLERGGDFHYYRFRANGDARPTVRFQRTGSPSFLGYLFGTKTIGGDLTVEGAAWDEDNDGVVTLGPDAFRVCNRPDSSVSCAGITGEFIFAVGDWNGAAGSGDFTYDVSVSVDF